MKRFWTMAVGSALTMVTVAPARPQPGIITGATGGIGLSAFRDPARNIAGGVPTNATKLTPIPLLTVPNTNGPELLDPLAAEGVLLPPLDLPDAVISQGSPRRLGVTNTGGDTNLLIMTNTVTATNATPTNSTGVNATNSTQP